MQQTTKYQLNIIETSDPFGPEPLNQNTQAVEDKLAAVDAKADAAQATADAAQATADSAFKPGQMPYAVGTYTGNQSTLTIEVGFRPSFVIIGAFPLVYNETSTSLSHYFLFATATSNTSLVGFTDTGFTVRYPTNISPTYPQINGVRTHCYIAFR